MFMKIKSPTEILSEELVGLHGYIQDSQSSKNLKGFFFEIQKNELTMKISPRKNPAQLFFT